MEFTRLRVGGFKSFVEAADLRIEPGLTGVVGPNGCGKSNLLEAIRWVMGEGSPKSLRSAGMDDVIFAGTAARASRDIAEVVLALDNRARTAPAAWNDADDIEVTRRIERGLGSTYRIGGREARLRDVQLLFADNATGAHSPALVSQGRIGAIIAARPDERRALLEEAAGIAGLHVRRKEAEVRLRATEANLARLDEVLAGMAGQAAALRKQARIAARYIALNARIRVAEGAALFARWQAERAAAETARDAAQLAEAAVADAARAAAQLGTRQADLQAALPDLRDSEAAAAAALQSARQSHAAATAELARVEARRRELAASAASTTADHARETELADDARAAVERIAGERAALADAVAATDAALPGLAAVVGTTTDAAEIAEAGLRDAVEAEARAVAQARAAQTSLAAAEARWSRASAEHARLTTARGALAAGPDGAERRDVAEAAAAAASADIAAAAAALADADAGRRAAEAARETARGEASAARGERTALIAERDALARSLAAAPGDGGVIDQITVAPGYEAALVAALGDDLSAGIGEGARHWRASGRATGDAPLPPGTRSLVDVVEAPSELARRLHQVGIVDESDANRVAAQLAPGQRLVTVGGRLLRWDGFRSSGGEGRASSERLRQRARLAGIAALLPELEARVAATEQAVARAQAALAGHADAETRARAARTHSEAAQAAARGELSRAAALIAERSARLAATDSALARLAAETATLAVERDIARAAAAPVDGDDGLAATVALRRAAAARARADLAAARAAIGDATRRRDADRDRDAALARDAAAWAARAATSATRLAALADRAATIAAEIAALDGRPAAIAAALAVLDTLIAAHADVRGVAAAALADAESELRAVDTAARAASDALADAREARARAAADAGHAAARLGDLARHCGERFGTAPAALPERLGLADDAPDGDPGATHDALLAEPRASRPGQSARDDRTRRNRRDDRRVDRGACRPRYRRPAPARQHRRPQPRRARPAAHRVRNRRRAFPHLVRGAVRRRRGASRADRLRRSARGGAGDHGATAGQEAAVARAAIGRRAGADRDRADLRAVPDDAVAALRARRGRCAARRRQCRTLLRPARPHGGDDVHALPRRHPQCRDDEPDAPPLRRDDGRAGGQPARLGRSGARREPGRSPIRHRKVSGFFTLVQIAAPGSGAFASIFRMA